ncbi:MAG: mechanosensitive ion channel [Planctomycetes bacterium]|nr:mechanosensitive ion channel [Planctomycetota bacterium]
MLFPQFRPALIAAACAFLCGSANSDDKTAPPPRPTKSAARPDDKKPSKPIADDREQIRKELEARFAGRPPEQALTILEQLAQEWAARKGAYEVARHRFAVQTSELAKARQRLNDHKLPAVTVPPALRAADVGAAIQVAQELAAGHAERVKHLEAVRAALGAVVKAGEEFAGAVRAADNHLFAMQTAAALAKGAPGDKMPPAFAAPALADAAQRLKAAADEVKNGVDGAKAESGTVEKEFAAAKTAADTATAKLDALKATQTDALAAFAYEDRLKGMAAAPLADEFNRLRKELAEKSAAIRGDEDDYKKAAAPVAEARAKLDAVKDPLPPEEKAGPPLPPLEAAAKKLFAAQQHLAARARVIDERTEKAAALVAAFDEQEKKALAYSTTLDGLRGTARHLAAAAAEIERRVGRGDLEPAKVPDGVSEAVGATGARAKFDAEAGALQAALLRLRKERDALRKPDAEAEGEKALVAALLANVNERIDLHTDLKRLAADYAATRAARSESEQKRLEQRAADRVAKEAPRWDVALALDRSGQSADIASLLGAYYKELVELDEKDENLKRQKEALGKLVGLTQKEAVDVAKLRTLLEKKIGHPGPAQRFDAWLAARLAPEGLRAEADAYHAEVSRLDAVGGSNARRVQALTGNAPEASKTTEQTKLPADGGEIGAARRELLEARVRGLVTLGVKIGLVLFGALVVSRLAMFLLRRAVRGGTDDAGNPAPVLRPLRGVLRLCVWFAAIAVVLSVLGYDVTALVVALAVVALAAALAVRPMIADVLGSIVIFAERRFKVGDVVRLGGGEPARVAGLTWRSTSLKNANGLVSSVPNRAVAEATVENLSRGTETYDTLTVTVSTDKDAAKVINVIRSSLAQCKNLSADQGVTVVSYVQRGAVKVVQYRFWWFLKDYETRNKTRDEVFARIAVGLAHEDMTGIEIALA